MTRPRSEMVAASFEALLAALHSNREQASQEYERLRSRLIGFFDLHDATGPEDLADEALNRLARRLSEGESIENLPRYLGGIARLLLREHWSNAQREKANRQYAVTPNGAGEDHAAIDALEACLEKLPSASRALIQRYYSVDGNNRARVRSEMAESLGISVNALRNRAFRIRDELERCLEKSLEHRDGRSINGTIK